MIIIRIPKNITYLKDNSIIEENVNIDDYETISMSYIESIDVNDKLIKKIERIVRTSYEYNQYREFLRDELDSCSFFNNLDYDDVSVELHHVITLYEVTDIVLRTQLTENINVIPLDVAEEVMRLHYECILPLAPLSKTIHDLLHEGLVFLPIQCSFGDYKEFYNRYKKYFTTDQINMLKNYIKMSNEVIKDMSIPDILQRNYKYLEVNGMELPYRIELDKKKKKID